MKIHGFPLTTSVFLDKGAGEELGISLIFWYATRDENAPYQELGISLRTAVRAEPEMLSCLFVAVCGNMPRNRKELASRYDLSAGRPSPALSGTMVLLTSIKDRQIAFQVGVLLGANKGRPRRK